MQNNSAAQSAFSMCLLVFRFVTDKSSSSEHPFLCVFCVVVVLFNFLTSPYATFKNHTAGLI